MSTLAGADTELQSRKSNPHFRSSRGNHTAALDSGRESPMVSGVPSLTFSTSICLDRASEIRYNILRRMKERKVLVVAIHDFSTGRRDGLSAEPKRSDLQSTRNKNVPS